jgi:amino-acid N-acetyltransferase
MPAHTWKIEKTNPDDLGSARRLLSEADLPTQGLEETELWCARDSSDQIVGIAGLETWGRQGLLRSVVVEAKERKSGLGKAIVERILREAKARDLVEMYLLTETAPRFFAKLGFRAIERASVKGDVLKSVEFREVCPDTPPMKLILNQRRHST